MKKELPKNVFLHPNGKLWVNKVYQKKRLRESLRTTDTRIAKARAEQKIKDFIAGIESGKWDGLNKTRSKRMVASVGQAVDAFRDYAALQGLATATVNSYVSKLRRVLEKMLPGDWRKVSTAELTPELCERYVEKWILERGLDEDFDEEMRQDTVNMAQGELRNAAAIFGKKPRAHYRKKTVNLKIPSEIFDFGPCPSYPVRIKEYELPDLNLIEATLTAGHQLEGVQWLVFVGCFELACRGSDLANARTDWIKRDGEAWCLDVPKYHTKGKRGHRKPISNSLHAAMQREIGERAFILPGDSLRSRLDLVQRGLFPAWMRALGWTTNHLAHELRALKGSYLYCHGGANGHLKAKQVLGHSSIATTEKYYADPRGIPSELHSLFTRWADEESDVFNHKINNL